MTTTLSTKEGIAAAFVNARLVQTRLVSEQIDSVAMQSTTEPKPVQFKAETTAGFTVALDHPQTPKGLLIEVQYNVALKLAESDKAIANYSGKHAGEFKLIAFSGFEEWANIPHQSLIPYFAMMHNVALRHAQRTLFDMGLGAIVLPVLTEQDLAPPPHLCK